MRIASIRRWATALVCLVALCLLAAPSAWGADRVYWANFDGNPPTIEWANLDGSGTGIVPIASAPIDGPMGLAIDSAAGRIYWTNYGEGPFGSGDGNGTTISWSNLDGSGAGQFATSATVAGPHGPAIDTATQTLYWPNDSTIPNRIAFSKLDGSGAGTLNTGTANMMSPRGPAIDPAGGRIYWANHDGDKISYANLDGSGGADLPINPAEVQMPEGVAIDRAAGHIYWGNFADDTRPVAFANLDGTGAGHLNPTGASVGVAHGIALDAAAGKIYWANYNRDKISYVNLDGGGGDLNTPGANIHGPALPILQTQPAATVGPRLTGGDRIGDGLSCSQGTWASDLVASQLYRAPERIAYQWTENRKPIPGATAATFHVSTIGDYRCVVTATNAAGSTVEVSTDEAVFRVGRVDRNTRKGIAKLSLRVPEAGTVRLSGKGLAKRAAVDASSSVERFSRQVGAGRVKVPIKARGGAKRRLDRTGRAKLRLKVTFTPKGGTPSSQRRSVRLIKR